MLAVFSNMSRYVTVKGDVQEEEEYFPLQPLRTLARTSEQRRLGQEKGEEHEEPGGVVVVRGPADDLHR